MKPVLIDLGCGAGGATKGYQKAGFYVIGVDIRPQPNYCGDEFFQSDALTFPLSLADVVHASMPCQSYSRMSNCRPGLRESTPRLIEPIRQRLVAKGVPYVMENVVGSPLIDPILLCGTMFGLELYRHRLFETNFQLTEPLSDHQPHLIPASRAGHWIPGTIMNVCGNTHPAAHARRIMEIDWTTIPELSQAIPPAYTYWIGKQLIKQLTTTFV